MTHWSAHTFEFLCGCLLIFIDNPGFSMFSIIGLYLMYYAGLGFKEDYEKEVNYKK